MENQITFWKRFKYHIRFFVPAVAAIALALPETHSLFSAKELISRGSNELVDSLVIGSLFLLGYTSILLIPGKIWLKTLLVSTLNFVLFSVNVSRVRGASGFGNVLSYIFESSMVSIYVPLFCLVFALIAVDNIKSSSKVIGSLYVITALFFVKGIYTRSAGGVWDGLIAIDVRERIQQLDYESEQEIIAECQRISSESNRSRCVQNVVSNSGTPFCPADDSTDRTQCLSQVALAKETKETLRKCDEPGSGASTEACYYKVFYSFPDEKVCEQLENRNWVIACHKSIVSRDSKNRRSLEPITAIINH